MRILITAPYHENARQELEEAFGEIIYRPWKDNGRAFKKEELINLLEEAKADALITEHDQVTSEVIEAFPGLKFIGVCRGTPSNVDLATASENDIPVFHTPARNAQAVAEMFIANVITFMRNTLSGIEWLKGKKWQAGEHTSYLQFKGNELAGKTIGMVGFGAIGQLIAKIVKDFPCEIQFYDPYIESPNPAYKNTTLKDIFSTSDIVSVHLPVTNETENMINTSLIGLMKPDSIFVNTARASVVNREDLLHALENHLIRGAILDVFDNEPPDSIDYRIINLPNVFATPHIAGATFEVEDHHSFIMNKNILNWFLQEKNDTKELKIKSKPNTQKQKL